VIRERALAGDAKDNGEVTARPERDENRPAQKPLVRNAVEDICHKNEVRWVTKQFQ